MPPTKYIVVVELFLCCGGWETRQQQKRSTIEKHLLTELIPRFRSYSGGTARGGGYVTPTQCVWL